MAVNEGDFLFLDQCSIDQEKVEGQVLLTSKGKPVFTAKLKNSTLKILNVLIKGKG